MKSPEISVVLCVRNGQKYIKQALDSILNQTYKNFELIIVDDFSTDQTLNILKQFKDPRIKIIVNDSHLGLTKSLNKAIKMAKGEYIARMDADDISLPIRLKTQIDYLRNHPEVGLVGSWVDLVDSNGKKLRTQKLPSSFENIKKAMIIKNQFYHPTLMIPKNVFKKVGYYDEKYDYSQDYDLVLRIATDFPVRNIPRSLLLYRVDTKGAVSYNFLKKQAICAMKIRLNAINKYGYPKWYLVYLLKPLISLLVPKPLLLAVYKIIYFRK